MLVLALVAAASLAIVHADFADAARMGGGRSLGMQRSIVPPAARTAPQSGAFSGPAANPVMPARPGAATASPAPAAAAAAAPARGASRWLGPLAGVAAGLGLAALFSHFGLSDGLGSVLLIGLLVFGAIVLLRAFAARRTPATYPNARTGGVVSPPTTDTTRPSRIEPTWGATAGSAVSAPRYPPGFDPVPFIAQAKQQFHRLQAAYDRGDDVLLADVTTPAMQAEIARDLATRGVHTPTEVVTLDADIVEVVREGDEYVASVRFQGALREDGAATPQPFEEVWNLVKPVDGSSGWLLAGIQQYA
jgi:predicted lipid-binding transport protein (Tim44 family)